MDTILLRKLARKSTLWFGKYNGVSIQQMLDIKQFTYLRWLYYRFESISFIPEILEEIGIWGDRVIQKPGACLEIHHDIMKKNLENMSGMFKCHFDKKSAIKKEYSTFKSNSRAVMSKGFMQAMNQNKLR